MIMIVIPGLCSYMIKLYIDSLTQRGKSHNNESVLLLVGIIVSCLVGVVMRTSLYLRGQITGLLLRKTLTGILYSKLLKLPVSGVAKASPGKLISLASGDMALIEHGSLDLHCLVAAPFATVILVILGFQIVRGINPRLEKL